MVTVVGVDPRQGGRKAVDGPAVGTRPHLRVSLDPLPVLRLYLVALIFSPPVYVVGPLGAAGTPAGIIGVVMLVLWFVGRLTKATSIQRPTALHWAVAGFVVACLLSFVAAMDRPASAAEVMGADRGLIAVASWAGVILFTADCVRVRERFDALLRFTVLLGACLGAMAIIQFFTHIDFIHLLHLPGLTQNTDVGGLYQRSGYVRVTATAEHSIELATVLGLVLPLAFYRVSTKPRRYLAAWTQLLLILGAFPLTVSRSGTIALFLGVVYGLIVLGPRQRIVVLLAGALGAVVFRNALPGLLGTIVNLFAAAGQDTSVSARQLDYSVAWDYFTKSPITGRGLFTFIPSMYRTFDNQYLGTLVEMGAVGAAALIALVFVPVAACFALRRESEFPWQCRAAVGASLAIGGVLLFTFDAMAFPMAMGMLTLVLGLSRGVWPVRAVDGDNGDREGPEPRFPWDGSRSPRAMLASPLTVVLAAAVVTFTVGAASAFRAREVYQAVGSFVVRVPDVAVHNVYHERNDTYGVSYLLSLAMQSQDQKDALADVGVADYTIAVGTGSLEHGTDVRGYGDTMRYRVVSPDPNRVEQDAREVLAASVSRLYNLQTDGQPTQPSPLVVVGDATAPTVAPLPVHRAPALAGVALLSALVLQLGLVLAGIRRRGLRPWRAR
ncbi:O-antigen ligase family protein [Sinomonas sp. ASV322]|uniref:O-antigen ligase family protein n=1 Tax=Sinomonas sp. ASV322 TaxID=3041920 RepID=UPI0027DC3A75|nr:O-antigen ligase family protein [Sinomonas sp. ASV322]MDQ4504342.1 O-antigen ligase family protein [Sinomonas sp. ASV322]